MTTSAINGLLLAGGAVIGFLLAVYPRGGIFRKPPAQPDERPCQLCGEPVLMNPSRRLIWEAHKIVWCRNCIPAGISSQLAEVSSPEQRRVISIGFCHDCGCELFAPWEADKHLAVNHRISWYGLKPKKGTDDSKPLPMGAAGKPQGVA
jgi:hypothetical protein